MKSAGQTDNAKWSAAYMNDLPDGAFLYIEPGGSKDNSGKTTPRSLRHFPYKDKSGNIDLPHLRNALSRIPQSKVSKSAKAAATAKAKRILAKTTKNELQHVTINFKANVRFDTMEKREYLVAPCVSIVEGVHHGSTGSLYYPAEELAKTPQVWNHRPVVVYHPEINGQGVSACDPVILSTRKVGLLMNTEYDSEIKGLKHEVWIDVAQCTEVDERVLEAVHNCEIMECSTGLWTDNEAAEGEWEGEPYSVIARNYRPDHLALLPDKIGACSVADGAGFLRVNSDANDPISLGEQWAEDYFPILEAAGIDTQQLSTNKKKMGHAAIHAAISSKLNEVKDIIDSFIEEVYDKFFIYYRDGDLYMQKYTADDGEVDFSGLAEQVFRVIEYRTASGKVVANDNVNSKQKGITMDKQKLIDSLIANEATRFTKDDQEFLAGLEVDQLEKLKPLEQTQDVKPDEKQTVTNTPEVKDEAKPATLDEYISQAPTEMQPVLRQGIASYKADKARLINTIQANERNQFTAEQLNAMDNEQLKAIAVLAAKEPEKQLQPIFDGQGDISQNADDVPPLVAPPVVMAEK